MSQMAEQRLEKLIEQFETQGGQVGMENSLDSPQFATLQNELFAPTDIAKLFTLVTHLQVEHVSQQHSLNDMQHQIESQRLATAELLSRSQIASSTIAKFEQVALNTAAAAEQLEAEIIVVRDTCDSMREGASKEMAAFRTELEESRSQHYFDIAELCANFANKSGQEVSSQHSVCQLQASDGLNKQELNTIMEARDHALRDQMTQALDAAQQALSKNFLEEHAKLLVELVEDREKRQDEAKQLTSRLDAVAAMHNNALPPAASSNPTNPSGDGAGISMQLDSMREAIQELRVYMDQDTSANDAENNDKKNKPATERSLLEELAIVRKDIASCLDAANAAVRLGEHLTNELHLEVEARCSDMKALRVWATKHFEASSGLGGVPGTSRSNALDSPLLKDACDSTSTPQLKLGRSAGQNAVQEDQLSVQDRYRGNGITQSPLTRSRDLTTLTLWKGGTSTVVEEGPTVQQRLAELQRKVRDGMQDPPTTLGSPSQSTEPSVASVPSMMHGNALWNSQNTLLLAAGSQNLSLGLDASGLHNPGIMLSGGSQLARRQQNVPVNERYLNNQMLASSQLPPHGGPAPATPGGSNSATGLKSPRQIRMPSPIKNYHLVHGLQRVDMGQAMDPQDLLRRQQGSPLREPPLTASRQAPLPAPTIVAGASSASFPSGPVMLDSSRRVGGGAQIARSLSPVQRRASAN